MNVERKDGLTTSSLLDGALPSLRGRTSTFKEASRFILYCFCLTTIVISFSECSLDGSLRSRKLAIEKCREWLTAIGIDTLKTNCRIYPDHPINLDTIRSGAVQITNHITYEELMQNGGDQLANRTFWKCHCFIQGELEGSFDLFVDYRSAEVLLVMPPIRRSM